MNLGESIGFKMSYAKPTSTIEVGTNYPPYSGDSFLDGLNFEDKKSNSCEQLFDLAESHYYGTDDKEKDYELAFKYYNKAIKAGHVESLRRVGTMYRDGDYVEQNKNESFQYFKEGAKKGDIHCYGEIAELFSVQRDVEDAMKTWEKYFELISVPEVLLAYFFLVFIHANKLEMEHYKSLSRVKGEVLELVTDLRNESEDRSKWDEYNDIRKLIQNY